MTNMARSALDKWGPQAIWDLMVLKSLLRHAGDFTEKTLMPVASLLVDDPESLERDYASLVAKRRTFRVFDSPRDKWAVLYGNFVRELEFALEILKPRMSDRDFEKLVVDGVHQRLENWIGFLKPWFMKLNGRVPRNLAGPEGMNRSLHAFGKGPYRDVLSLIGFVPGFLVGPTEIRMDDDGVMEIYIPDCALHRVTANDRPQDLACLYGCKAACEKLFGRNDAMAFDFSPELPGFGCSLKVYMAGHPNIPERIGSYPKLKEYCSECDIAPGCEKRRGGRTIIP